MEPKACPWYSLILTSNPILSIIPSETFQVDDGVELTLEEKQEVEQMQKDEELRRRDPVRHYAMVMERRVRHTRDQLKTMEAPAVPAQSISSLGREKPPLSTATAVDHSKQRYDRLIGGIAFDNLPKTKEKHTFLQPESTGGSASQDRMPTFLEPNTSPVSCTPTQSSEVPAQGPATNASYEPSNPEAKVTLPECKSIDWRRLCKRLGQELGFLCGPRYAAPNKIPATMCQSERKQLEDAMCLRLSDLTIRQTYAIQIASLIQEKARDVTEFKRALNVLSTIMKQEAVDPPTLLRLLFGILNLSNQRLRHFQTLERATNMYGNAANPSMPAKDSLEGDKTVHKANSALRTEYNRETPPRGKKRNLLTEDDASNVELRPKEPKV